MNDAQVALVIVGAAIIAVALIIFVVWMLSEGTRSQRRDKPYTPPAYTPPPYTPPPVEELPPPRHEGPTYIPSRPAEPSARIRWGEGRGSDDAPGHTSQQIRWGDEGSSPQPDYQYGSVIDPLPSDAEKCPICRTPLDNGRTTIACPNCGQRFHYSCLSENGRCPMCQNAYP